MKDYYFKNCDIAIIGKRVFIERIVNSNIERIALVYKDDHWVYYTEVLGEEK